MERPKEGSQPTTEWESEFRDYLVREYGIEDEAAQGECIAGTEQLLIDLVIKRGLILARETRRNTDKPDRVD